MKYHSPAFSFKKFKTQNRGGNMEWIALKKHHEATILVTLKGRNITQKQNKSEEWLNRKTYFLSFFFSFEVFKKILNESWKQIFWRVFELYSLLEVFITRMKVSHDSSVIDWVVKEWRMKNVFNFFFQLLISTKFPIKMFNFNIKYLKQ